MVGIIIESIALGVDIPHIDKMSIREDFEKKKKWVIKLEDDYLETMELGKILSFFRERALLAFKKVFGSNFGISRNHDDANLESNKRPMPKHCVERLLQLKV